MKSVHTDAYKVVIQSLKQARQRARLTQQQLAERLDKPQSFVAKYENGERRVDVAEFIAIARAIGADPVRMFSSIAKKAT
jgi:transcriptional regulator with XRE-family HTH domain